MQPSLLKHTLTLLLDAFFPIECLGCGTTGTFLCALCLSRIPEREFQECPECRKPYARNGALCTGCRKLWALDGLFVAAPYTNPLLDRAIHTYKYRFIETLSLPLASLLERSLNHNALAIPDMIVPVPLHPRRLRFRGFNQAHLLAQELSKLLTPQLPIPVSEPLFRTRFTKPQMKTRSAEERRTNMANGFAVPPERMWELAGKSIWLLDDVATTGTTLNECAKALKRAGAKRVWGVVLAR